MISPELLEELAALGKFPDQRWSGWMTYFFSKCIRCDKALLVPAGYVEALRYQISTPYAELSQS